VGKIWDLAKRIYPLNRSISGIDNLRTLEIIKDYIGDLNIKKWEVGEKFSGWEIPKGWNCKEAWIKDQEGKKYAEFNLRNIRVTSYSEPINRIVGWEELKYHLHLCGNGLNGAYPYTTSFYNKDWGFNVTKEEYNSLKDKECHVLIDSEFIDDWPMHYGELIIPGESSKEILLSTYICHPSMANNETSGICVTSEIGRRILNSETRNKYTIRMVFHPETIGSIFYIRDQISSLKKNVIFGLVLTCLGDTNRVFSYPLTINKNNILNKCIKSLRFSGYQFESYPAEKRGSDERQYAWPTVGLDVISLSKSKYHEYPEYHTSLDNLDLISEESLITSIDLVEKICTRVSKNRKIAATTIGEPFLMGLNMGSRTGGMSHKKNQNDLGRNLINMLWYCDGENDTFDISEKLGLDFDQLLEMQKIAIENNLAEVITHD
tara:strand:- start:1404 stop:2702 length:1299 start_codon:yes stop_codon:yes gene_type:complete